MISFSEIISSNNFFIDLVIARSIITPAFSENLPKNAGQTLQKILEHKDQRNTEKLK